LTWNQSWVCWTSKSDLSSTASNDQVLNKYYYLVGLLEEQLRLTFCSTNQSYLVNYFISIGCLAKIWLETRGEFVEHLSQTQVTQIHDQIHNKYYYLVGLLKEQLRSTSWRTGLRFVVETSVFCPFFNYFDWMFCHARRTWQGLSEPIPFGTRKSGTNWNRK
jgi:hypothetical protein